MADVQTWTIGQERVMNSIASSLRTLANWAEADEKRKREMEAGIDTGSLGALALWRAEVFAGRTTVGFAQWNAWHESDKAEAETEPGAE